MGDNRLTLAYATFYGVRTTRVRPTLKTSLTPATVQQSTFFKYIYSQSNIIARHCSFVIIVFSEIATLPASPPSVTLLSVSIRVLLDNSDKDSILSIIGQIILGFSHRIGY